MFHWKLLSAVTLAVAVFVTSWSCGTTPTVPSYDRTSLLHEVADQVIVPGYMALEQGAQGLEDASHTLCTQMDDAALAAARDAWQTTFLAWHRTAVHAFGPATDDNLGPEMAFWPAKAETIEATIAGDGAIDQNAIDALGGAAKGLYALEYLLFGPHGSAGELSAERRCAYVAALAEHVHRTSSAILTAWTSSDGGFAQTLASAGESGNSVYPAQLSAVSALMTGVVTTLENVKDKNLGGPLGLSAMSKVADPGAVESVYAEASVAAMQASLAGVRAIWNQTDHNFDAYLRSRDDKLADDVLARLASADANLAKLPEPFTTYVSGADRSQGQTAHDDLDELERLFTTDVDVTFAVNLMFNANDGD